MSLILAGGGSPAFGATEEFLVRDGLPQAQIVVAKDPPRMTKLASEELQTYIEKISKAKLPVVTEPDPAVPLTVYVGRSEYTDKLGLGTEGLEDGAFRMVSGPGWLALLGQDSDFEPAPPHTMQRRDNPDRERMLREWDKLSGGTFNNPHGSISRERDSDGGYWAYDERGSLNAVHEFLRRQGVRWYMPGDLGEIVPSKQDIRFTTLDEVVRPAFGMRRFASIGNVYSNLPPDQLAWQFRLGLNAGSRAFGNPPHYAHGLREILGRPEMEQAHPEYYALVEGKRRVGHGNKNQACLSSEALVMEAANFARAMFDVYDQPSVSVSPQDGFRFCECELCEGKDTPERGRAGTHSDYVWGFVDRVAREVAKTHPDKKINALAYSTYTLPPEKIDRLSPNVVVGTIHARGRFFHKPEEREKLLALRRAWQAKTDNPLWNWEHYPLTHRGNFTPAYFPRSIAEGIRSMKGEYNGEFVELATGPHEEVGHGLSHPAFNHLNVYLTSRFYWNPDLDLQTELKEYYQLFYGPAAADMEAFVDYSEENWREMLRDREKISRALELFDQAKAKASPESAYGQRLAMLDLYLKKLRSHEELLGRERVEGGLAEAPVRTGIELDLDGRLDEEVWKSLPAYPLLDLESGAKPEVPTWFKVFWQGGDKEGHLVVGIYCEEPNMENLRTLAQANGDLKIFSDDSVEVMLETQAHSHYQLAVNAAGALADMDRNYGKLNELWSSQSEVAAHKGNNFWSVELRIPVTGEQVPGDPFHELAGWRPTAESPWFVNVARQRFAGEKPERLLWALPPAGTKKNFHDVMSYGRLQ